MRWESNSFDTYWRLASISRPTDEDLRQSLSDVGYDPPKTRAREELVELIQADSFRFIAYSRLLYDELLTFIVDRKLPFTVVSSLERHKIGAPLSFARSKEMLVETLIDADRTRQFTKLFQLPTELRDRVFEYYVSDFNRDTGLYRPSQPPLARTCRALREDVLPIFHQLCKFRVEFTGGLLKRASMTTGTTDGALRMTDTAVAFFSKVPSMYLRDFRTLQAMFTGGRFEFDGAFKKRFISAPLFLDVSIDTCPTICRILENHAKQSPQNQVQTSDKGLVFPVLEDLEVAMNKAAKWWQRQAIEDEIGKLYGKKEIAFAWA
ncbi:hypothetical protein LTR09_003913 [Extremus antarcticus]|uniref:Uncharacterized protein n=1 Tax=Extremus antarcticus TaxID=702011 RepID=A0AAJ0DK06_9PEZI|nr:hypothetical protein LTR09_003913 [Extremus antarcticus]